MGCKTTCLKALENRMGMERMSGHFLVRQEQRYIVCSNCFCIGKARGAKKKDKMTTHGMQIETYFASAQEWAEKSNMVDTIKK